MTRSRSVLCALPLVVAGAGCTHGAPEVLGHVDIALTAPGPGGITYRLPPQTELDLFTDTFSGQFLLDGDASSLTVDVPPGDYHVLLFNPAGYSTVWPLTRQRADGTIDTVQATRDALPMLTVTDNQTTPLAIRFHVAQAGPITFSHGSAQVFVEVDQTAATAFQLDLSGPDLTTSSVTVTALAPPELPGRLPALHSTGQRYALTARTVGPWLVSGPISVCAPVQVTIDAAGQAEFADLVTEANGEPQLCIVQFGPHDAAVSVAFFRAGKATTPLLGDLGDRSYVVVSGPGFALDANLFDGTTLDLGALIGTRAVSLGIEFQIDEVSALAGGGEAQRMWIQLFEDGDGTATFTPL